MEIPDIEVNLLNKMSDPVMSDNSKNSDNYVKTDLDELNYLPCLIFPKQDLRIRKYNRLVKDTKGISDTDILARCAEFFKISEIDLSKGLNYAI